MDLAGLRPTTDRIRETVFNWLAPEVVGRHCLDLFAGSGALGLEALSRGAASCVFVERDRRAVRALGEVLATLRAEDRGQVVEGDAMTFLASATSRQAFDLVFLDPPFDAELLDTAVSGLQCAGVLGADAQVYLEYATHSAPDVPAHWECWRSKRSGNVTYELYRPG